MESPAESNSIGKRVGEHLYVHVSALDELPDSSHRDRVAEALKSIPAPDPSPNVIKIHLRSLGLSLLAYPDFEEVPFPELAASWTFPPGPIQAPRFRTYTGSLNPPILHRKELLVVPDHPRRSDWLTLSREAESLGLFDDVTTIGFRQNWYRLIEDKGYRLVGGSFQPIGNETTGETVDTAPATIVHRHRTALSRSGLSAPVQLLLRHGLLTEEASFFDYGCGKGDDVEALVTAGVSASGWDPHFAPEAPISAAEVVNLGFVVNVIEDPAERVEAITKAFALARSVLSVSVMLHSNEAPGRPYRDGVLTSRGTFQKYFTQAEFKDYMEQVLHREAFLAGPGVAFVFADVDAEQRFLARQYRSYGLATRLLALHRERVRKPVVPKVRAARIPRPSRQEEQLERVRPLLDRLWAQALDLGRYPERDEAEVPEDQMGEIGALGRALRLLSAHYDQSILTAAAEARADDLRLFLAMQRFNKRPSYRQLEPRLQRDIRAFFGNYQDAQAAGLRLLHDAADPDRLLAACRDASAQGLGWIEGEQHSLQCHVSSVDRLPVILRAYVACGMALVGASSSAQLIKIHIGSGKLSLMEFDDFDASPIPLLIRRIKINIRRQDYDLFEYGSAQYPKTPLYRKGRYLPDDHPQFAEQTAFDEVLEALVDLGSPDRGPPLQQLQAALRSQRREIKGFQIVPSTEVPALDTRCGRYLTYRQLLECGETQRQVNVPNTPENPASYNALYDLARYVLDEIIDYFGGIHLTYGFCSVPLGKHIRRRVAPKLDQHAAYEFRRDGHLVCDRGGAACDFLIEDENMDEVADWIIANLPFDRLYFYGRNRPIHVSYGPQHSRLALWMKGNSKGAFTPRPYKELNAVTVIT